tara:strand:- start:118 stop:330 length:213 start_codon:yes stop_codon:yes gene_type:complete
MLRLIKSVRVKSFKRNFSNKISFKDKITQEKEENDLSKEIFKIENKHMNNECDEELDRLDQVSKKHSEVN